MQGSDFTTLPLCRSDVAIFFPSIHKADINLSVGLNSLLYARCARCVSGLTEM